METRVRQAGRVVVTHAALQVGAPRVMQAALPLAATAAQVVVVAHQRCPSPARRLQAVMQLLWEYSSSNSSRCQQQQQQQQALAHTMAAA